MATSMDSTSSNVVRGMPYCLAKAAAWNDVGMPRIFFNSPDLRRSPRNWIAKAVVDPVPSPTIESDLTRFAAALPTSCFIKSTRSDSVDMMKPPYRRTLNWYGLKLLVIKYLAAIGRFQFAISLRLTLICPIKNLITMPNF